MHPWNENYSPEKMLDYASIDALDGGFQKMDNLVQGLLALYVTERDPNTLVEKMKDLLRKYSRVSIGSALQKLYSVAKTGSELDFGRDGLDCLTYHLSSHCCENGIWALKATLARFESDKSKPAEIPRYKNGDTIPSFKEKQTMKEFIEGYEAFKNGVLLEANPHTYDPPMDLWKTGWRTAKDDKDQ